MQLAARTNNVLQTTEQMPRWVAHSENIPAGLKALSKALPERLWITPSTPL